MSTFNQDTAAAVMHDAFPPFLMALGLKLESIRPGRVTVRLPFNASTSREGGIVSGQALAALADTAMVCALWASSGEQRPVATVDLHVTYLRGAQGEDLMAEAEVVKAGRSISFAKVTVASVSTRDKPVATAVGTFATA